MKFLEKMWDKISTNFIIAFIGIIAIMFSFAIPVIATENKPEMYYDIEVVDTIYLNNGGVYVVVDDEDYAGVIQAEYWQYKLCEPGNQVDISIVDGKAEITAILPPETNTMSPVKIK